VECCNHLWETLKAAIILSNSEKKTSRDFTVEKDSPDLTLTLTFKTPDLRVPRHVFGSGGFLVFFCILRMCTQMRRLKFDTHTKTTEYDEQPRNFLKHN